MENMDAGQGNPGQGIGHLIGGIVAIVVFSVGVGVLLANL